MNKIDKIKQINFKQYLLIGFMSVLLFSCEKVLDKNDLTKLDDRIWEDASQIELYINNLYYKNMPNTGDDGYGFGGHAAYTDETFSTSQSITDLLYGFASESTIGAVSEYFHKDKYQLIRRINICLEGIEDAPVDEAVKAPLRGQALFLRAWRYWEIVKHHGGVPIIKEAQDPYEGSEALDVPRSKTKDAINEIIADLDQAIADLPIEWTQTEDKGRINSGAAAAFKGRILLAWASPMFNPNNDQTRWQRAYDANKQAVDLLSQMSVPRALHPNFSTIFTSNVLANVEAVIYRRYSLDAGSDYTHGWENSVRPYSGGGGSGYTPTWNLVQAFPMANGKLINDAESGYDETLFWKDRDPRFYATIAYNGSEWNMNGRESSVVWCFRNSTEGNRVPGTGFYNKKATDPNIARVDIGQTSTAWIELRYAEVMLNLAECANELGNQSEALTNVRAIRERAGIESGGGEFGISNSVSKEELRELIMIERQVEFAFENKRYWDLRRRKMYREDLGNNVKMLNGTQRLGLSYRANGSWGRAITDKTSPYYGIMRIDTAYQFGHIDMNDPNSVKTYWTTSVRKMDLYQGQNIELDYKALYDFFAVPSSMLQKSVAVEQTLGWLNGTFDPLAE